jgi:hypothetical protein
MLVGLGLTSLILATLENRYNIRAFDAQCSTNQRSLAVLLAALISLVGIVVLFAIILRQ